MLLWCTMKNWRCRGWRGRNSGMGAGVHSDIGDIDAATGGSIADGSKNPYVVGSNRYLD